MNEIDSMSDWKAERIRAIEESLVFWSEENKFRRECHVVMTLLLSIDEPFNVSDLVPAEEPVDVRFRDCNFQIKEVMQSGRKRHDEYVRALERARRAERCSDLLTDYTPKKLALSEIVQRSLKRSIELTKKYGPRERANMDLVCYVNFDKYEEVHSTFTLTGDAHYRSLSIVSNSYVLVLYANAKAPKRLQNNVGQIHRALHPDHS